MPNSIISTFGEVSDFETALRADGVLSLLLTRGGRFRARLTQIALHRLRLVAAEENLPRIAYLMAPPGMVLVSLPIDAKALPLWEGITMRAGEIITLGPNQHAHVRTNGPARWGILLVPNEDLARFADVLNERRLDIPSFARWRPSPVVWRHFRQLFRGAIRVAEGRTNSLSDREAAHGLEQQLIDSLLECLSRGPADRETRSAWQNRNILSRFEEVIQAKPNAQIAEVTAELGVSALTLRACCKKSLGVPPSKYVRLRRMRLVHRALRGDAASFSRVAREYGFRDLRQLTKDYRALYAEAPLMTLPG
jgi:AraC family ethanolamine operon transcriptional activator